MAAVAINRIYPKCGEITKLEHVYALNCIFCAHICLQLETFAQHIEEEHRDQLALPVVYDEVDSETEAEMLPVAAEAEIIEEQKNYAMEINISKHNRTEPKVELEIEPQKNQHEKELKFSEMLKESKTAAYDFYDPLEEQPLTVVSMTVEPTTMPKEEEDDLPCTASRASTDEEELNKQYKNHHDEILAENSEGESYAPSDSEQEDDSNVEEEEDDGNDLENDDDSAPGSSTSVDHTALTLALIAGYEKHRILWDTNQPMAKNRKKREEAFRKIATTINKQLGMQLRAKSIMERIKKLRYKFRSELQSQKLAEEKGTSYTPQWLYYEKLAFLNTSIKYKQRNKRGAKALSNEKPALPLSNLSDAQTSELIAIYKSVPCLWNDQHIGFRFKNQRQEALDEMQRTISERMSLQLSQDELQKKLYRIRYAVTQEKHRRLQQSGTAGDELPACGKFYAEIAFLEAHVGPFRCADCGQTFNGVDQFKMHRSKHDGSMPFTCPLCQRGFAKVGNCTVHLRRHTRDYPFECSVCGKRYATSTDINVHMRYHTGEKPYFCEICGQSFRTWTFFDAHMRRHQKRPTHKCSICAKAFYENNKLTEHMKAHLNVRDKVCNVCGKSFTSAKYLRQHKQIHAEKKQYACKICGKDFAQYAGLSGHMKSHGTTVGGGSSGVNGTTVEASQCSGVQI